MAGATDADWVVKLIDVFAGDEPSALATSGYELMVSGFHSTTATRRPSSRRS